MCTNKSSCGSGRTATGACTCGGNGGEQGGTLFRIARAADAPVVHRLICEAANENALTDTVTATPERLVQHLFGEHSRAEAIVVHAHGQALGFAVWHPTFSSLTGTTGAYLETLYIRPPFRQKGVGQALLQTVAQRVLEQGCERLEWQTLKWNQPALAFYGELGAETRAEWIPVRLEAEALRFLNCSC